MITNQIRALMPKGDCERPSFDQLNAHILEPYMRKGEIDAR